MSPKPVAPFQPRSHDSVPFVSRNASVMCRAPEALATSCTVSPAYICMYGANTWAGSGGPGATPRSGTVGFGRDGSGRAGGR